MNEGVIDIIESNKRTQKIVKSINVNDPAIEGLYEATKNFIKVKKS